MKLLKNLDDHKLNRQLIQDETKDWKLNTLCPKIEKKEKKF